MLLALKRICIREERKIHLSSQTSAFSVFSCLFHKHAFYLIVEIVVILASIKCHALVLSQSPRRSIFRQEGVSVRPLSIVRLHNLLSGE